MLAYILHSNIPLFVGYTLVILGVVAGLAGNRKELLERVRHRPADDDEQ